MIEIIDDLILENNETFSIMLVHTNPSDSNIIIFDQENRRSDITIVNDDGKYGAT